MRNGQAWTVRREQSRVRRFSVRWFLAFTVFLALLPWLFTTGCASVASSGKLPSPTALFALSPAGINFGQVAVGKQTTQSVSVQNTGNVTLKITQATVSNPQFSVTSSSMPMSLAVGQAGSFEVSVDPTAAGTIAGTLTVTGNAGSSPVTANLQATALASQPQLSVSSTSLNFGTVSIGQKGTANLVLSNLGSANLTVSLITVTGEDFSISGITTPAVISAGQTMQVSVSFSPTAAGSVTGNIAFTSNDPVNPTINVGLSGTGSSNPTGQLTASPLSLSFGSVGVGTSANQSTVLTNTGNAAVQISQVTVSGSGFTVSGVTPPLTLNPSQTVTLTSTFQPAASGSASGTITVASNANNPSLTVALSGTGVQAGLSVSPATFDFGSVVDGQTKSKSFTVTNNGTASLTISGLSLNGAGFSAGGLTAPLALPAGRSTTFSVLFAPTTAGSATGTVQLASNAPNSPNTVSLSGTGMAASVTLSASPISLSFPSVNVGSSASQNVTISNTGNTSATISQVTVSAKDFTATGMTTPMTLAVGQSATLGVTFTPAASENVTGNITVSSAQGASSVVAVSGVGTQPGLTVTPSSINFGNVAVGTTSTQTMQLSNSGTGTLTVSQVSVSGAGFSTSSLTLPLSLTAGQSASFTLQYAPSAAGTASGSLSIASNAPGSPTTVPLSGSAVAATETLSFSATSLSFGSVTTGTSSTQNVTVTNTGNSSVTISQITASGTGFSLTGAGTPVTVSAGQNLVFGVVFDPTAAGAVTGTVTVTSNATGSPATITLSGTGVQAATHTVTLNWNASTSTVSGYNVYRSTTSGSGYSKVNSALVSALTYLDSTVQGGTTYYYVTTAVNSAGQESTYSNQATAVIP